MENTIELKKLLPKMAINEIEKRYTTLLERKQTAQKIEEWEVVRAELVKRQQDQIYNFDDDNPSDDEPLTRLEIDLFDILMEVLKHYGVKDMQKLDKCGFSKSLLDKIEYAFSDFDYAATGTDWRHPYYAKWCINK